MVKVSVIGMNRYSSMSSTIKQSLTFITIIVCVNPNVRGNFLVHKATKGVLWLLTSTCVSIYSTRLEFKTLKGRELITDNKKCGQSSNNLLIPFLIYIYTLKGSSFESQCPYCHVSITTHTHTHTHKHTHACACKLTHTRTHTHTCKGTHLTHNDT